MKKISKILIVLIILIIAGVVAGFFIWKNGESEKNNTTNQNWLCPVCNYKEKFTANIFVIAKSNQLKPIDYSLYKYDQSLKRCYNECPKCKKIRELCIFYYENNSMKNGYVCTYCGKFFTN